ncbi:copper-binding protein [Pseudomonas sp. CT11-2]|uniref:copper-binding protein n=1 Tax=unclassified Pseudomonas TaxID=196821 RepID=UPI00215E7985|nr:copper-binding protein [Pseudomonas sp. B21-019]UVM30728.1 copper-binding protein [Pseudomonas sp. B21-019]
MKLTLIATASTLVALAFPAHAAQMPGMKMDDMNMDGTPTKQQAAQAPVAKATGTVKAIDSTKHTLTIAHGAVPAVQWPPMTMGFRATEEQLASVKVGDKVNFEFQLEGATATITSIEIVK